MKKAKKQDTGLKPKTEKKPLLLPNDEPVKLDMSFEEAIKKALNTKIKNNKKVT